MPAIVANELQDMQLRSAHVTDEVSDAPGSHFIVFCTHHYYAITMRNHILFDIVYRFRRDSLYRNC